MVRCRVGLGFGGLLRALGRIGWARGVVWALPLVAVALQIVANFRDMDQSDNRYVYQYGMMHLERLPADAVLLVKGDVITNSIRYLQRCEGVRPDVDHLDQSMMTYYWFVRKQARHFPGVTFPNAVYHPYKQDGFSMQHFLDVNALDPTSRPYFLCGGWYHDETPPGQGSGIPGYVTRPMGPCDRIFPEGVVPALEDWIRDADFMEPDYSPPSAARYGEETWEHVTLVDYWMARHKLPHSLLDLAMENGDEQETLRHAAVRYEALVGSHPDPPDYFLKNAGIVFGRLRGEHSHCNMVHFFSRYLRVTNDGPEYAREVFKMVRNYVAFTNLTRQRAVGAGADPDDAERCAEETEEVAQVALAEYLRRYPQTAAAASSTGKASAAAAAAVAGASEGSGSVGDNAGVRTVNFGGLGGGD